MRERIIVRWCGYAMFLIMVLIVMQVIARYIFKSPFSWTDELARIVFIWASMAGVYIGYKQKRHIGIEAMRRFFGNKGRQIAQVIEVLLILFFVGFMTWYGTIYSITAGQKTPALGLPMWLVYSIIPLSGMAIILESFYEAAAKIRTSGRKDE